VLCGSCRGLTLGRRMSSCAICSVFMTKGSGWAKIGCIRARAKAKRSERRLPFCGSLSIFTTSMS